MIKGKKMEVGDELFMVIGADKKAMRELKAALEKKVAAEFGTEQPAKGLKKKKEGTR
jgi:hypothetical protein